MAPFIHLTTQVLLSLRGTDITSEKYAAQTPACRHPPKQLSYEIHSTLAAISWGYNRMDVFGSHPSTGEISHKWFDGYQWGPSVDGLESLGGIKFASAPSAVSWGADRTDIFAIGSLANSQLYHKYWDGHSWQPAEMDWEGLGGDLHDQFPLAVTSWAVDRLDVFGIGQDGELYHKYWDGSVWNPSGDQLERLAPDFEFNSGAAAVSWGHNRIDVFAIGAEENMVHIYWDGSQWSEIEDFGGSFHGHTAPTAIARAKNRLDVFAVDRYSDTLAHKYWDGSQWSDWGALGGKDLDLQGTVAATSWGENRMDLVALGGDGQYYYKFWDGHQWNPSVSDWYPKNGSFVSSPAMVSWGENRLDIYGVDSEDQLGHQTWYGSGWYPAEDKWEKLGGPLSP